MWPAGGPPNDSLAQKTGTSKKPAFLLPKLASLETNGSDQGHSSSPVSKGNKKLKRHKYGKAMWYYKHTGRMCPDKPAACNNYAVAYYARYLYLASPLRWFYKSLSLAPENTAILYNISLANLLKGQYQNAADTVDLIVRSGTEGIFFRYNAGLFYAREGKYAQALMQLDRAMRSGGQNKDAHLNRAWVHLSLNNLPEAWRDLKKAGRRDYATQLALAEWHRKNNDLPTARKHYWLAHRKNPKASAPLTGLAKISILQGKFEEAKNLLSNAVCKDGSTVSTQLDWAALCLMAGDADRALAIYQEIAAHDSLLIEAKTGVAMALAQTGRFSQAKSIFESVLSIRPNYLPALYGLGGTCFSMRDKEKSIGPLEKALAVGHCAQEKTAHLMLGLAYAAGGDDEKSLVHLQMAEGVGGKGEISALVEAGLEFYDRKKYHKALRFFDHAAVLGPDVPAVFLDRGNSHFWLGNYPSAEADFLTALRLDSTNANAWNGLGLACNQLQKYPEAISAYHRAIALDSSDAWLYSNLGDTYKDLGMRFRKHSRADSADHYLQLALQCVDTALKLNPNNDGFTNNRGLALMEMGRQAEAMSEYDRSRTQASENNKAVFYAHHRRDFGKGLEQIEQAIKMDSLYSVPRYNRLRMTREMDNKSVCPPCEQRRIEQLRRREPLTSPFEDKYISIWYIHVENQPFEQVDFPPEIPLSDLEPVFAPFRINFQILSARADCPALKDNSLMGGGKTPRQSKGSGRGQTDCYKKW